MANQSRVVKPGSRFLIHFAIHVVIVLAWFLPGGLLWNRLDPAIGGMSFAAFTWMVVLPVLIILNMVFYVRAHWAEDKLVTSEVRGGASITAAQERAEHKLEEPERRDEEGE